jgi:hypothetical protein
VVVQTVLRTAKECLTARILEIRFADLVLLVKRAILGLPA